MVRKEELMKVGNSKDTNGGYVYILLADDKTVKVGITVNPYTRILQIESASGKNIIDWVVSNVCSNYREIEKNIHDEFKIYRLNGEWFNVDFLKAVRCLNNMKLEPASISDLKDTILRNVKSLKIASEIMKEFKYKEYNYTVTKYNIDYNIKSEDVDKVNKLILEHYEYNKEVGEDTEYLEKYISQINSANAQNAVVEYCKDYVDMVGSEEILVELGLYDLFNNILHFYSETKNHIVDEFMNRELKFLYDEYGEDVVKSIIVESYEDN